MDTLTKAERSVLMRLIRSKDTKPELAIRRLIHGMGYRYRLHGKNLPGCPDIVFSTKAKVIFVHGCFWHLHRNCSKCRPPNSRQEYWKAKLDRNAERDKRVRRQLLRIGWHSLVIWECELGDLKRISGRVQKFLT